MLEIVPMTLREAGATMEEAMRMTQVYLSAILFGRPPAELEQGDE